MRFLFSCIALIATTICSAEEFDSALEARFLKNIQQLTYSSMGFSKAGESYFSHDGKYIAFQAVPDGEKQYQIYVMNLEEGIPRMVSTGRGACTCASFRKDGKKMIFASSHEDPGLIAEAYAQKVPGYKRKERDYSWEFTPYMNIYEANLDGTELKALTTGPDYKAECAYSEDGVSIVFAGMQSGSMNLYTMKSDGRDMRQVTYTSTSYNGGPFFSPDGSKIIFRADREKQHYLQIYSIDRDGKNERKLTNNGAVNWAPYWHPNGTLVAYTTSLHGHEHYEIYLMNVETLREMRLTHNASFDGLPSFDKAGKRMIWTSKRSDDGSCQIFMADFFIPVEIYN